MADYHAKLRAIVDGEAVTLTPDDAKAIHVELWDLRSELGRKAARVTTLEAKTAALDAENADLVAQVLKEERAALVARLEVATAREILRECVDKRHNPRRARAKAAAFLLASKPAAP